MCETRRRRRIRRSEKWDYFEKFKYHPNPLPMDKILLGQSLKH